MCGCACVMMREVAVKAHPRWTLYALSRAYLLPVRCVCQHVAYTASQKTPALAALLADHHAARDRCVFDGCPSDTSAYLYVLVANRNRAASYNRWLRSLMLDIASPSNPLHPRCICAAVTEYTDVLVGPPVQAAMDDWPLDHHVVNVSGHFSRCVLAAVGHACVVCGLLSTRCIAHQASYSACACACARVCASWGVCVRVRARVWASPRAACTLAFVIADRRDCNSASLCCSLPTHCHCGSAGGFQVLLDSVVTTPPEKSLVFLSDADLIAFPGLIRRLLSVTAQGSFAFAPVLWATDGDAEDPVKGQWRVSGTGMVSFFYSDFKAVIGGRLPMIDRFTYGTTTGAEALYSAMTFFSRTDVCHSSLCVIGCVVDVCGGAATGKEDGALTDKLHHSKPGFKVRRECTPELWHLFHAKTQKWQLSVDGITTCVSV